VHRVSELKEVRKKQTDRQRHYRRADEPAKRTQSDTPDYTRVAERSQSGNNPAENQRRDHHLDQTKNDIGDQRQLPGDRRRGSR
jgi:hypothetical protein